jgi:hypothetical protein
MITKLRLQPSPTICPEFGCSIRGVVRQESPA